VTVALFIATRGASHPWLCVPTVPEPEVGPDVRRALRHVRGVLRGNAAALGEPCRLRAVVVTGPEVGGPHVALVVAADGRIGRVFPGRTLAASAGRAIGEANTAARRAARRAA
jgi:hypothetical protein